MRSPSPAGHCHPPTAELAKIERGPISTIGLSLFQYVTESGDSFGRVNKSWAVLRSAETGGVDRQMVGRRPGKPGLDPIPLNEP